MVSVPFTVHNNNNGNDNDNDNDNDNNINNDKLECQRVRESESRGYNRPLGKKQGGRSPKSAPSYSCPFSSYIFTTHKKSRTFKMLK